MSAPIFPLRWESTGEQWWYASPIDCAAANGYYDLVRELLHIDTNLLIKLTSLRRIQRLEALWDDDQDQSDHAAKCRAHVARNLLLDCETPTGHNTLIRAGYGGWILYTAAAAGDVGFVMEALERDPLLVFGEGEFGITDLLYAAARSKSDEVFKLLLESTVRLKSSSEDGKGKKGGHVSLCDGFKWEMRNRAVHALARGGNLELLKELLMGCSGDDVLGYRDGQGSTVLHAASGRGQVEVVKHLITCYGDEIVNSFDHQGNTALHIAAYRGFSHVVEALLLASPPPLALLKNQQGDTFLHMAVAGFQSPGFHRINLQFDLLKRLINDKTSIAHISDIINISNYQGKTALHSAVAGETLQSGVVELLMTASSIDLNHRDKEGNTPLDLLKRRPHQNATSKLLIKKMVSSGAVCSSSPTISDSSLHSDGGGDDGRRVGRSLPLPSHLRLQGYIGNSPGTSFRVPDSEILFLYPPTLGTDDDEEDYGSEEGASCCSYDHEERSHFDSPTASRYDHTKRPKASSATNNNTGRNGLKELLQWPIRRKETTLSSPQAPNLIPLRQRFTKVSSTSLVNNKRVMPVRCDEQLITTSPSPTARKKFTASLIQGVIQQQQQQQQLSVPPAGSVLSEEASCCSSALSPLSRSSSVSSLDLAADDHKGTASRGRVEDYYSVESPRSTQSLGGHGYFNGDYTDESPTSTKSCGGGGDSRNYGNKSRSTLKQSLFNRKLMNRYFCFGAQGLALEESVSFRQSARYQINSVS